MDPPENDVDLELVSLVEETLEDDPRSSGLRRKHPRRQLGNGAAPPPPSGFGGCGLPRLVLLSLALAPCAPFAIIIVARPGAELDADAALATTRDVIHDVVLRDAPLGNGSGDDGGGTT